LDLRHASLSGPTLLLLVRGAVVHSAAALVYATKRPNPAARDVFEYHEVFHALTIAAAGMHVAAVASVVLPAA
jgi:hemolysin III